MSGETILILQDLIQQIADIEIGPGTSPSSVKWEAAHLVSKMQVSLLAPAQVRGSSGEKE